MTTIKRTLRSRLEALAEGRAEAPPSPSVVAPTLVKEHAAAFEAWARFCSQHGEPVNAPAELLAPLP